MTHTTLVRRAAVVLVLVAWLGTGCTSDRETSGEPDEETRGDDTASTEADGGGDALDADFGSLTDVCQDGDGGGATAQGVTEDSIQVGTVTDVGFTESTEFIDAAEVFTQWCNANGGINGREITFETRDAALFEYQQRILEACESDFLLVGGGGAFDQNGVEDRISCGLPEIPGQTVSAENSGAGFQVVPVADNPDYGPYEGYFEWLLEQYPDTADSIGIIAGDILVTQRYLGRETETMEFLGADVVYSDLYPPAGLADWTPYAQAIEDAGVEGLVFLGNSTDLPSFEQALQTIDHPLEWIDANTNAYNSRFLELGGAIFDDYTNYMAPLIVPTEAADDNPATQELVDIYAEYAPDAAITGPAIQAWSAWLLFATAARDCGADLTRRCVFDGASSQTDWSGGGVHASYDLSDPDAHTWCSTIVTATPDGFEMADYEPTDGLFLCKEHEHELEGDYGSPVTIEDVGMTLDDLQ